MEYKEFIVFEESNQQKISLNKIYVDITGDLNTGLLLSQIVYWNMPSKKTNSKRSGENLVKKREEWWDEIRLRPRQYDRAAEILKKNNLITVQVKRSNFYGGDLAQHIRLNINELMKRINNHFGIYESVNSNSPGGEKASPVRELEIDETDKSSISNTTAYTTTDTTGEQGSTQSNSESQPSPINIPTAGEPEGSPPALLFETKTDLHNRLKYDFAAGSSKLDSNGEPYYHDGKEAGAINELIKRGMAGGKDLKQAYELIRRKAMILYCKIENPTKEHFSDMAFSPSILLGHWNNLKEERPIKPRSRFAASLTPEVLKKLYKN